MGSSILKSKNILYKKLVIGLKPFVYFARPPIVCTFLILDSQKKMANDEVRCNQIGCV